MQESPAQSPEAGEEGDLEESAEAAGGEADSEPAAHQQIEAISSGTERQYTLCLPLSSVKKKKQSPDTTRKKITLELHSKAIKFNL